MSKTLTLAAIGAAALMLTACGKKEAAPASAANTPTEAAIAPPASHVDAPKRKAGLWEFTDLAPNGDELQKSSLCVGDASEAKYSAFDQIADGKGDCTQKDFAKDGDGWTYTTVCGVPGMKPTTTKGKITGDIQSAYRMDETLDISVNGDRQARSAKWVGACPAGFKDGDMQTPMMKYSVLMR